MRRILNHARRLVAGLILASVLQSCGPGRGVDLVLRGGNIYTLDPSHPWAEALAIESETIRSVGPNIDMDRFIGTETTVIELGGRTVLPGFHDSSVFFLEGSMGLNRLRLNEVDSVADILDLVGAHATTHPEVEWITGSGRFGHLLELNPSLRGTDLDAVVTDRPVFVEDREARLALLNSTAMKRLSMDSSSGLLSGEAIAPVRSRLPQASREEKLEALRRGIEYAHRFGVTSIQTTDTDRELYEELSTRRELLLRVVFAGALDANDSPAVLRAGSEAEVRAALAAFEKADRMFFSKQQRYLDGVTVVSDDVLPKFAALDVTVIAQPYRVSFDFVENQQVPLYAWKTVLRSGTRLVFGSHWPRYPLNPFLGIFTAVTRQNLDGKPEGGWFPSEKLSIEEAIRAYTGDGALTAGVPADLVVASDNLFKVPSRRLAEVETVMTLFGGRVVYASPSFLPEEMRRHLTNDYNE
jgi:predicted amidohydrolase YtcJ